MKLLLHACCGPCSLEPTRLLTEAGHEISIAYMNSNIHPQSEYERRRDTLRTWADELGLPVVEGMYDPDSWERVVGKLETFQRAPQEGNPLGEPEERARQVLFTASFPEETPREEPEKQTNELLKKKNPLSNKMPKDIHESQTRTKRCRACYRLRFNEVCAYAAKHGFDGVSTTLSVSPYQFTDIIQEELQAAGKSYGLKVLFEDFRPYYQEATRRSRELEMYRQNYCGCHFSEVEAAVEREERKRVRKARKQEEKACADTSKQVAEQNTKKGAEQPQPTHQQRKVLSEL